MTGLDRIRDVARNCGYAIAVHGSQTRDLDLIAAPWTPEAVSASELVAALCEQVPLVEQPVVPPMHSNPEPKPWGRFAWSLGGVSGFDYVDLSVCPRAGEPVPLVFDRGVRGRVVLGDLIDDPVVEPPASAPPAPPRCACACGYCGVIAAQAASQIGPIHPAHAAALQARCPQQHDHGTTPTDPTTPPEESRAA